MNKINTLIRKLESWSGNRIIPMDNGFYHLCFELTPRDDDFVNPYSFSIPRDLQRWWEVFCRAELYKDIDYGQWGLIIFSEKDSYKITQDCFLERQKDFDEHDIVIGRFIGDLELLVINCSKEDESILIADPIDARTDWYKFPLSFSDFLEKYMQSEGNKYWE